jgi:hypothetical protein
MEAAAASERPAREATKKFLSAVYKDYAQKKFKLAEPIRC